jgi:glutamate-1-semialdehyde aminotransferase
MHPLEIEAARALTECVPCAEMVRFFKTGAEATSAAARLARAYTGRELVLSSGYHGWLDTWTAERDAPSARGVPQALKSSIRGFAFGDFDSEQSLEALLKRHPGQVAAVVMEPVSYATTDSAEYLGWARRLAERHGALLVFDEIVSGFRVALGGAQQHYGVTPDLACFAKGISNGLPLAALTGRRKVMQLAAELLISSTYGGEALSLAALVACLKEYRERDVIAHLWKTGQGLVDGLNALASQSGLKLAFRGFPMMASFGFGYNSAELNADLMTLLLQEMARRKVLWRRGGLLFVNYSHKQAEVEQTLRVCGEVFRLLGEALATGSVGERLVTREAAAGIRRF